MCSTSKNGVCISCATLGDLFHLKNAGGYFDPNGINCLKKTQECAVGTAEYEYFKNVMSLF